MSTFEHIFIRAELEPAETAAELAPLLMLETSRDDRGNVFLSRPALSPQQGVVGGAIRRNPYGYPLQDAPDEESFIDGYNLVWDIGYTGRDPQTQRDEAIRLLQELATKGRWPVALLQGLDLLIACYDNRSGYHEFPEGTSPDIRHRDRWEPYRQPSL